MAAPGTKLSPVITPPVLTVTSAVACCHHGFLTERTATLPPFGGYSPFRGAQYARVSPGWLVGRLPPRARRRAAGRAPGYPPDAGRLLRIACTCGSPGLPAFWNSTPACWAICDGVPPIHCWKTSLTSAAAPRAAGDRRGAAGRVPGPGDELRRAGVALAVGRLALKAGLDERAAARRGERRAADDVVDRPRRDLEAVDRVGRVVRVVQVKRPGDVTALRRLDRLEALAAGRLVDEARVVAAGQQREDPEHRLGVLVAGEVEPARLGRHVGVLAGLLDLRLDRRHAGRPAGTAAADRDQGRDDPGEQRDRGHRDHPPVREDRGATWPAGRATGRG